jgi:deoxyadenosine/deoxycytidine kinase
MSNFSSPSDGSILQMALPVSSLEHVIGNNGTSAAGVASDASDAYTHAYASPRSISSRVYLISIEGNIGSGKSTFLRVLKSVEHPANIIFLPEPVHVWETICDPTTGENIISKFYADQKTYAFSFQIMAYISRLAELRKTIRGALDNPTLEGKPIIIIMERCLLTDRHVFAKMLYEQGAIEPINYQIYLKWFDEFASELPISTVFYVRAKPEISHERIMRRARDGEGGIPLEYLSSCHDNHDEWLFKKFDGKLYVLHGDLERRETADDYKPWVDLLLGCVYQTMEHNLTKMEEDGRGREREHETAHS